MIAVTLHMLTTIDNPYDPFTQFDEWIAFDHRAGHYTLEFLGRVVHTSSELSEADQDEAVEDAIDEIVRENVQGVHTKVPAPADWEP
jgi:predicted NAD/FAD-dependent oxidoreductase